MGALKDSVMQRMAIRDVAEIRGKKMAREVFRRRGNHTEAHLGESELAALIALAYDLGATEALQAKGLLEPLPPSPPPIIVSAPLKAGGK